MFDQARDFIALNKLPAASVASTMSQLYIAQSSAAADKSWSLWSEDLFSSFVRLCDEPTTLGKLLLDVSCCVKARAVLMFFCDMLT